MNVKKLFLVGLVLNAVKAYLLISVLLLGLTVIECAYFQKDVCITKVPFFLDIKVEKT